MSFLTLSNIKKSFGSVQVVHDFNMAIEKGIRLFPWTIGLRQDDRAAHDRRF